MMGGTKPKGFRRMGTAAPVRSRAAMGKGVTATVPNPVPQAVQKKTFREIFARLDAVRTQGGRGVVEVDFDLTSLLGYTRVEAALRNVYRAHPEITEFANPKKLSLLPGYTDEAIAAYPAQSGLAKKYPHLDLGSLIHQHLRAGYWSSAPWETDVLSPGLLKFIDAVRARKGEVVFVSNRPGGEAARQRSLATLTAQGVREPKLPLTPGGGDAQAKQALQPIIAREYGTVVAVIDDRATNRAAILEAAPSQPMSVAVAAPRFSWTPDAERAPFRISTFEY